MSQPAIELKGISKAFGPVQANKDISIRVMPGTIHGIIGENGAGKSTLMSILYGFYKADAGEIFISGQKTAIPDSQAAISAGIGMVFQHFKLVENFTVLENIVLGAESGAFLAPSLRKARAELAELAAEYELNVDPDAVIEEIGVGMQQRVEILKALYRRANILILDEPTGVLTPTEADQLFRILGPPSIFCIADATDPDNRPFTIGELIDSVNHGSGSSIDRSSAHSTSLRKHMMFSFGRCLGTFHSGVGRNDAIASRRTSRLDHSDQLIIREVRCNFDQQRLRWPIVLFRKFIIHRRAS